MSKWTKASRPRGGERAMGERIVPGGRVDVVWKRRRPLSAELGGRKSALHWESVGLRGIGNLLVDDEC